ncbi:MAG: response regulator [Mariprofundaceae bacterium]
MTIFKSLSAPLDPGQANIEHFRSRFSFTLIMAGSLFLLIFATLDWFAGLKVVAVADVGLTVALVSAALYMRQSEDVPTAIRACIASLFVWFLVTLPHSILINLWMPIFPLAAFFGLGRMEGMRWSLSFLLAMALEMLGCRYFGIEIASDMFLFSTIASLALVILTVIFYQRLLEIFEQAIRTQSEQLLQAQKMESVGLLASGVAHDFNNLLVGVMGNAELALMSVDKDDPLKENLDAMMASAQRGSNLVRQLLAFAGKAAWKQEQININELLEETRQLMAVAAGQQAELSFELADELPKVEVDTTQIQQMLVNLLVIATEAASPERRCLITFRSGVKHCSAEDFVSCPINFTRRGGGKYVFVKVEDNGLGMDAAIQSRVFEPFFTTKEAGSGLGLAAVAGTLRRLGGALNLKSERGRGTCFTIWLPAAEVRANVQPAALQAGKPAAHKFSGTVLLADDEMMVRKVGAALLERSGLKVLQAENGRQAMDIFSQNGGDIDLLILDYAMPEMTGAEVFDAVRKKAPGMPVIVSSGYADLEVINRMQQQGAGFVQKPFRVAELLGAVRSSLES